MLSFSVISQITQADDFKTLKQNKKCVPEFVCLNRFKALQKKMTIVKSEEKKIL